MDNPPGYIGSFCEFSLAPHLRGPGVRSGREVHDELRVRVGKPSELRENENGFSGAARPHDQGVPLRRPQSAEHERVPDLLKEEAACSWRASPPTCLVVQ